jgi:hypothetical protein
MTTPITPEQAREAHLRYGFQSVGTEDARGETYTALNQAHDYETVGAFIDQSAKRVKELEQARDALLRGDDTLLAQMRAKDEKSATLTASLQKAQQQEEQWRNTASAAAAELLAARASLQKAREMMRCDRRSAWLCRSRHPCVCATCTWWRETGKEGGA